MSDKKKSPWDWAGTWPSGEGGRTVYGVDPAEEGEMMVATEGVVHEDGTVEVTNTWEIPVHVNPRDWQDPVTRLVHEVLYDAAKKQGPKALAAEAELRDRGDHARADMAFMMRVTRAEMFLRNLYWEKILDPEVVSMKWDSPA